MVKKQDTMSGRPFIETFAATTTASTHYPPVKTNYVQIHNKGAAELDVHFDSADAGDANRAIILAANGNTGDYWEGPAELFPAADPRYPTRGGLTFAIATGTGNVLCIFYSKE